MLLIRNANIKTMAGPDLKNGCLLLENGKIAAVGQTVDAPEGAVTPKDVDAAAALLRASSARPCDALFRQAAGACGLGGRRGGFYICPRQVWLIR